MRSSQEHDPAAELELIEELELSEPSGIASVQVRDVVKLRVAVEIEPGNASSRDGGPQLAETREISRQRVRVTLAAPLCVGDVYLARFEPGAAQLPDSYLLCVSCRMLRDRDFEAELEFFKAVDLEHMPAGHC